MSLSPTLRIPFQRQRRRQRWPFILAFVVVALIVGWQAAKWIVDADHYRPYLIERITKNTGLPAVVDRMDLVFFPAPALQARNISVGEGDFRATCANLVAYPRLSSLIRGVIDVGQLKIGGLAVTLPSKPGDLKERVDAMLKAHSDHIAGGEKSGSGVTLAIGRIDAPDATITLDGATQPVFAGDLAATDVLADTIRISADAASPAYGENTRLTGEITLKRNSPPEIGLGVEGDLNLANLDTKTLFSAARVPAAVATVHAKIERTLASRFKITLDGNATPVSMEGIDLGAIAGAFTGVAWWDAGQITVNDLNWKAPGLEFASDITIQPDGAVATRVKALSANRDGLQAFLSAQPSASYRVTAAENAQATAKDLLIGMTPEKKLLLREGAGSFSGLDLTLPKGQRAFAGFTGELAFANDAIKIVSLKAEDLSLKGTVKPNLGDGTAAVNLQGTVKLTRERLGMAMPLDAVKDARGNIALEQVAGTFSSAGGVPNDLSITGKLTGGSFEIESASWSDQIKQVEAEFKATPGAIDTVARASTQKLGEVTIDGKYAVEKRTWSGTARGNLAKMDLPFLKQEAAKKVAPGILAAYGDSQFTIAMELPGEKKPLLRVQFDRKSDPKLSGVVVMVNKKEGWELGDVTGDAAVPGDALQPMMPETVHASGLVPVHFVRDAAKGEFNASVNLRDNAVALGGYLAKRAGTSATIDIHGVATSGNWAAKTVKIVCLDQTINGHFTETRFEVPQFDISAGALAVLLPEGAKAGGQIRGKAATQPVEADLALDNVNVVLPGDLGVDRLAGAIQYRDGAVTCKDLAVRGADSDFTVDLVSNHGTWSGAFTGKQLNVNELLAIKDKLEASSSANAATAPATQPAAGFAGKFDVNMANVVFRKAQLGNVFTNVTTANGDVELANLSLANRGGTMKGWVHMMQPRGDRPASTSMSLRLDNVDLSIIDEIALETPRGVKGPASGQVDLEIFTGPDLPMFAGANGAVQLKAKDGTFGRLGIATKVLAVLRTLEITRLRAPKLKDEGLTFDTCESVATFKNGVMELQSLTMTTPSYIITAFGKIDFNRQDSEILVHVSLLETVLGPANVVPGLDVIVDKLRTAGGLRILVTGPPTDPKTSYGLGPKANAITNEVRNSVKSSGNVVRDEIINRATDVLKGILTKP